MSSRYSQSAPTTDDPQKAFLRERFRARCIERAARDRERKIKGKRRMDSEPSSDMELEDEDEDEADAVMNDELFRRIMASVEHKRKHSYRVSYSHDVGSSYDPSIEEEIEWENELKESTDAGPQATGSVDPDEEELAEWAAEQELLEGLDPDEVFSLSDLDEPADTPIKSRVQDDDEIQWRRVDKGKQRAYTYADADVDMDL
ncbi:hypothetical protein NM688_g665 [Phlebia brevispora]|uniref:Uncharacterized protein n=1 Tax=Phlebia brevispora TaxID=194682 RepID=A0ACC1TDT9_9APHY|nr:hypothetical protein NM688_g665 [Phlebia brevispora]